MRLRNFLELVSADAEEARRRGVDQIVHWADRMAVRQGDLHLTVDEMDRETFDKIDVPQVFDGHRAWTKTMNFGRSKYGTVDVIFATFDPPPGDRFWGGPNEPEDDGA